MAHEQHSDSNSGWWPFRSGLVLVGFLAITAYFLWTEHRAHVVQSLPYILLLFCPLLHLFHGGHAGENDHRHGVGGTPG